MKHLLLAGCLAVAGVCTASAENHLYETEALGEVTGVSYNGEYATIFDMENNLSYLWTAANPTVFTNITATQENAAGLPSSKVIVASSAMGVADNGMVVGNLTYKDGHQASAYYMDGEWKELPSHPLTKNTTTAIAVTADAKIIGGYAFIGDKTSEIAGRYYPCQWILQDDGSYELKAYVDIELPAHQGFIPMAQSPDGSVMAGTVYCGMESQVPAILKDGKFTVFAKLETKREPFMYKGQYVARDPETNKQYFTDDINDPNIEWYDEAYVDGYKDGSMDGQSLYGGIQNIDAEGNCYGARTLVSNVSEDGTEADLKTVACYYNHKTDTWVDDANNSLYSIGFGGNILFTGGSFYYVDGSRKSLKGLGVTFSRTITGVVRADRSGKVLGGMTEERNPGTGELQYTPFILVLDEALAPNASVEIVGDDSEKALIILSAGRIDVANAASVAVYDLNGRLVSTSATSYVAPGVYVVNADKTQKKVIVK